MNHLFVYFVAGGGAVAILLFWATRTKRHHVLSTDPQLQLLDALEIRPQLLACQIFDDGDWKYVCDAAPAGERKIFLRERTNIALTWLNEMRAQAAQVMWLHRQASRRAPDLSASLELEIAGNYAAFLACCYAMRVAIRLRGPFGTRATMDRLLGCSSRLWQGSEQLLATLGVPRRVQVTVVEK
jgi:hypothetical protein